MAKSGGLVRNIGLNFFGLAAPLLVGLICIPPTIAGLGVAAFGLLSVAWVIIGYISIFDLGLGRALTHAVASRLGRGEDAEVPALVRKALVFMLILSIAGGALIAVLAGWAGDSMTKGRADLTQEASRMFLFVALAIPAVVLSSGLRGVLEAHERFGAVALVRSFTGIWTYLAPFLMVSFTQRLDLIVLSLVIGRYVGLLAFAVALARLPRPDPVASDVQAEGLGSLLRFGGWMTVSNTISPLMTNMDRFFVSGIVGVAQVAYYTTPFDMITRLFVIPEAVFGVVFPRMSRSLGGDGLEAERLYQLTLKILGGLMFAVSIGFIAFGHLFLLLWLNADFAAKSTLMMSLLSIGMYVNSVARPPYNLIQARGRSDLTAKLHLLELPLYIGGLVVALHVFGVMGAAIAWLCRIVLDYVLLTLIAKARRVSARLLLLEIGGPLVFALVLLALALIGDEWIRAGSAVVVAMVATVYFWLRVLTKDERGAAASALRSLVGSR
ncbi:polysaccharide biosynthesis protein [Brevundimonas intermedia]|uniref:Polysaccharide biosynthesis protein n=1 Tax=Brevundimonas intermedia TaxID=74315 RepID=A0ABQ5TB62_9CAUL|nr:flippase [Brevundimonas intermedia]GLK49325.1 polysaccharide biosynthesis protein [Brevundimonas intermedia]